jgi:hypothetical protein
MVYCVMTLFGKYTTKKVGLMRGSENNFFGGERTPLSAELTSPEGERAN